MMVEEIVYDDHIECHHSYDKQCHTTYTTDFEPQQIENCDENYVKEIFPLQLGSTIGLTHC